MLNWDQGGLLDRSHEPAAQNRVIFDVKTEASPRSRRRYEYGEFTMRARVSPVLSHRPRDIDVRVLRARYAEINSMKGGLYKNLRKCRRRLNMLRIARLPARQHSTW